MKRIRPACRADTEDSAATRAEAATSDNMATAKRRGARTSEGYAWAHQPDPQFVSWWLGSPSSVLAVMELQYPQVRFELIAALRDFANPSHHQHVWRST